MSLEDEDTSLKELVTKTLQNNGVLGKIQAQLRASVFLALEEEFREKNIPLVSPSVKQLLATREGALAAALVQDFLQCLNLDFSLSVFAPESGHSALWNFPGKDAIIKDLKLETKKDENRPLLLEILRERETPRLPEAENTKVQNNLPLSTPSMNSLKPLSTPSVNSLKPLSSSIPSNDIQSEPNQLPKLTKLPPVDLTNKDGSKSGSDKEDNSPDSQKEDSSEKTITNSKSAEEDEQESESHAEGLEKQYEEDFSSMSEKGHDEGGDNEGDDVEEEIEEAEDIEEDISDLLNSSVSVGSDHTKDLSLSQASDVPNYQEEL